MSNRFFLRAAVVLVAALPLATACAREKEVRGDYVVGLSTVDDSERYGPYLVELARDFNSRAGREILKVSLDPSWVTSPIRLTWHLQERDGKLGWGQWTGESSKSDTIGRGGIVEREAVVMRMNLELDRLAFVSAAAQWAKSGVGPAGSDDWLGRILFFHEAGHGLTFDHDETNERSVMFPVVNNTLDKDLDGFFERVRGYVDSI